MFIVEYLGIHEVSPYTWVAGSGISRLPPGHPFLSLLDA